jgi:hypothetical protein
VFSACLGVALGMTFGMYAMLFLTLYLQRALGDSALLTGIELLPLSVTFVVVSQSSGRIANEFGPRLPMTAGMAMMGTGLFVLALIPLNDSVFLVEAAMLVIGFGLCLNTGPVNAVAVNVPAARSGTASGLVNTARMIGATLGARGTGARASGTQTARSCLRCRLREVLIGSLGRLPRRPIFGLRRPVVSLRAHRPLSGPRQVNSAARWSRRRPLVAEL